MEAERLSAKAKQDEKDEFNEEQRRRRVIAETNKIEATSKRTDDIIDASLGSKVTPAIILD